MKAQDPQVHLQPRLCRKPRLWDPQSLRLTRDLTVGKCFPCLAPAQPPMPGLGGPSLGLARCSVSSVTPCMKQDGDGAGLRADRKGERLIGRRSPWLAAGPSLPCHVRRVLSPRTLLEPLLFPHVAYLNLKPKLFFQTIDLSRRSKTGDAKTIPPEKQAGLHGSHVQQDTNWDNQYPGARTGERSAKPKVVLTPA